MKAPLNRSVLGGAAAAAALFVAGMEPWVGMLICLAAWALLTAIDAARARLRQASRVVHPAGRGRIRP